MTEVPAVAVELQLQEAVSDDTTQPGSVTEGQNADASGEQETPQTEAQESTEQREQRERGRFQRRLDRHKEARYRAEAEAKVLRERIAELEARTRQASPEPQEPKRDDFDNYEAYLEARQDWRLEQRLAKEAQQRQQEQQQPQAQQPRVDQAQQAMVKTWEEREKAFEASTKDYKDRVSAFLEEDVASFSPSARTAIVESEVGPQLLYHLARHPEIADRISELSPVRQVAELGKLEANLAKAPKKPSNAPAPITPVGSAQTRTATYRDDMTQSEYEAMRRSQGARWVR